MAASEYSSAPNQAGRSYPECVGVAQLCENVWLNFPDSFSILTRGFEFFDRPNMLRDPIRAFPDRSGRDGLRRPWPSDFGPLAALRGDWTPGRNCRYSIDGLAPRIPRRTALAHEPRAGRGPQGVLGCPEIESGQRGHVGAMPVPSGKDAELPRGRPQGLLLLLRLPREGRRHRLRSGDRERRLHGGRRNPGAGGRHADARPRSAGTAKGRQARRTVRSDGAGDQLLSPATQDGGGERRARLSCRPRPRRRRVRPLGDRIRAARMGDAARSPDGQGRRHRAASRRGPGQGFGQGARAV